MLLSCVVVFLNTKFEGGRHLKRIKKIIIMSSEKNYLNDSYKSFFEDSLSKKDPELYKALKMNLLRQQQHIELIASENIVSQAVLEAQGSVLTNKYAEGYPGKRYYNGCEHVDVAENLSNRKIKKII